MEIRHTTLSGGLPVVTARLPGFESSAMGAFVSSGSRNEQAEESGAAHFLEHMAFKGTERRSSHDISSEIECLGAGINASTSQQSTGYYVTGRREVLADGLDILGDVLTNSVFRADDITMERGVILQEIAQSSDDPTSVAFEGFTRVAYPDQSLGRPVLGDPGFISRADGGDFRAFMSRNYLSSNMAIVVTGDFEHDKVVDLAERHFGMSPGHAGEPEKARWRGGLDRSENSKFEQVTVVLGLPSVSYRDPRFHAHKLLAVALGGGMSSPLFQEVRAKRGLVYSASAFSDHGPDYGSVMVYGAMTPGNLEKFLEVVCTEISRAASVITPNDFRRARNALLSDLSTIKERPFNLAGYLAGQHLSNGVATGPDLDIAALNAVTVEDIMEAARMITSGTPAVSVVGPSSGVDCMGIVTESLRAYC